MSRRNGKAKGNEKGASREAMLMVRALAPRAPNLRTGAYLRLPEEAITQAVGELVSVAPHLGQPRYRHAVSLLARLLKRVEVMDAMYSSHPKAWLIRSTASGRMEVSAGEKTYLLVVEQARRMLESLGLTPQSAKALGLPVESPDAKDLNALLAEEGDGG